MASTSVHLPAAVVERLDRVAARQKTSRNRIILQACEALLAQDQGDWPTGYFESDMSAADLGMVREAGQEMEAAVYAARKDRRVSAL